VRARVPIQDGFVERDGVRIHFEVFGDGPRTVLFLPTWSIVSARFWKFQTAFFSEHFRVLTFDGRGNGQSDRPEAVPAYTDWQFAADAIAVMDATGTDCATIVSFSMGARWALVLLSDHPDRFAEAVFMAPSVSLDPPSPSGAANPFDQVLESYDGWAKYNRHYWHKDYHGFLQFFFPQVFNEPHSSKQIEDCVGWGLDTTPEVLIATVTAGGPDGPDFLERCGRIACPVLVIHGTDDQIIPIAYSERLAEATRGSLLRLEGAGHGPSARDPVRVNQAIAEFLGIPRPPVRTWRRAASRPPRALFISSPIGLGHAQRDLAIARALRLQVPGLEIEWLAQPPVTGVLTRAGEKIHPLSDRLASESAHWEQSAGQHALNAFMAWRQMDEILLANFMVFLEAVRTTPYDVWIGDEAWEVDYFLHENPELKSAPFVFLTDFLGWLPIDRTASSREAALAADYNAEMIAQVTRYPSVRDRSLYIGDYDDLVPERFGPELPYIPEWARAHFTAVGYITPFDPAEYADTRALKIRLGYAPDVPLVMVAVGGTGVGQHLLQKVAAAWPLVHQRMPDARCVVVAGPRIDPASVATSPGMEVRSYVHDLYEHLAAADLGVVQGGLGSTMELTATRRPFIYFPLQGHCEQVYHVAYRLDRYGAGRRLDYAATSVEALAEAMIATIGADTSMYRPYDPRGATRAAAIIAELLVHAPV
jgi:pimeloyl-ACP methyl ester carboxylesterase/predicted glycosyltransferase